MLLHPDQVDDIIRIQIGQCLRLLDLKQDEYADGFDRLHNFRVAAALQETSMHQALRGMMAKHTISIYDMLASDRTYPQEIWLEKITDHINYLLLLRVVLQEEELDQQVAQKEAFNQPVVKEFSNVEESSNIS